MQTKTTFQFLGAMLVSVILTGCGGGDGSALDNLANGGSSGSSSSAVNADTLQSIEFKDAVPAVINLIGTGGTESSLVRFRLLGQTGQPISGIDVNFSLTSVVGGLKLSQDSGRSDKDGYVSTSVNSGNISTSIRVTATVKDSPQITTVSSELVIATGLPDQKSMSMALEKFNPAGWDYNGVTSKVTMLLADAYNNPAPDGTTVYFTTEGGSITPSCTTVGGGCVVSWTSQNPRPPRNSLDYSINRILCLGPFTAPDTQYICEAERAGRSTILATAIGNESFKDTNGNGVYDPGVDIFAVLGDDTNEGDSPELAKAKANKCKRNVPNSSFEFLTLQCDDLAEAYLDINENGIRDAGINPEHFINFITDTTNDTKDDKDPNFGTNYTQNNGIYNGAFCQQKDENANPKKCSRDPVTIRKQHLVIMSSDSVLLENGFLPAISSPEYSGYTHAVADINGNPLPVGSTITIGADPAIKVANQYDWTPIIAPSGASVKITIAIDGGTKELIYTAK
ncbi:MAG: hypothetical protein EOO53_00505 [Gammaproteobacteria bacterium]|nr:MAG: hypothetical protein EOO53_00505 [Gammaproteobacteria bacterium]